MPMSEPIMGWCIQCGKEHGGFYCPQDPNPPKNAAYWKRRAAKAENQVIALEAFAKGATAIGGDQIERIKSLEDAIAGMLAMYALGPNDDDWQHPAVKQARSLINR